ncbi:MAG: hypothetical protein RBS77_06340, partial [Candidatus Moranbacteria bacterium]|nr:hypothetical protein [Candidatus Moranbacteria bacterium]
KVGSYVDAENYYITLSNRELIEKIDLFKKNNPQYRYFSTDGKGNIYEPGGYTQDKLGEGKIVTKYPSDSATFFSCYFYFADFKASILCIVRLNHTNEKMTNFMLTAVLYDPNGSGGSFNNGDLSRKEEKRFKRKFETEILGNLGVVWKQ